MRLSFVVAAGSVAILSGVACGDGSTRRSSFDGDDAGLGASSGAGASGNIGLGASSSSSGIAACATAQATAQRVPIYLDIVLDGSHSMDGYTNAATPTNEATLCEAGTFVAYPGDQGTCYLSSSREPDPLASPRLTGKKWLAARGALKAFFDAHAVTPDPALGVGMYLFSSTASSYVPVGLLDPAQAAALWGLIDPGTWPDLGTPLTPSIESEAAKLRAFSPSAPLQSGGRRVILLITDGVPADDAGTSTSTLKDEVRSTVSAALTGDPSVATAVIGIGNPDDNPNTVYDPTFLSGLAKLGGVAAPDCDPEWSDTSNTTSCHLQVTPGQQSADELQAEFSAALDQIAGALASCELVLDKTSAVDPSKVNVVTVDAAGTSTQVPQDGSNGWTYDDDADPSAVILHGDSCDAFRANGGHVDIVVGCPTGTSVVN